MSTVHVRPRRQKRNQGSVGGDSFGDPGVLTDLHPPARAAVKSRLGKLDRLTGHDRSRLPLTDLQAEALSALSDSPAGPTALSARCSLSAKQLHSALWSLSAKGLAIRTSTGWRKP